MTAEERSRWIRLSGAALLVAVGATVASLTWGARVDVPEHREVFQRLARTMLFGTLLALALGGVSLWRTRGRDRGFLLVTGAAALHLVFLLVVD